VNTFFGETFSGAGTLFLGRGRGAENIKYKFRYALKLPSICIIQKCSMEVGSCTFFNHWVSTGVWRRSTQPLEARGSGGGAPALCDFGDLLQN